MSSPFSVAFRAMVLRLNCPLESLGQGPDLPAPKPHPAQGPRTGTGKAQDQKSKWSQDGNHLPGASTQRWSVDRQLPGLPERVSHPESASITGVSNARMCIPSRCLVHGVKPRCTSCPRRPRVADGPELAGPSDHHGPDLDGPGWSERGTWPH